jgi:hypothetical protein
MLGVVIRTKAVSQGIMLGDVCLLRFLQTIDLRTALRPANALESQRRFPISSRHTCFGGVADAPGSSVQHLTPPPDRLDVYLNSQSA